MEIYIEIIFFYLFLLPDEISSFICLIILTASIASLLPNPGNSILVVFLNEYISSYKVVKAFKSFYI